MREILTMSLIACATIAAVALVAALAGYLWLWSRYLGARHSRRYANHMLAAEQEFGVSRHLIAAIISGEALDALRYCRDWLEPLGELAAIFSPKWREASSYGAGQLRLYEVRRFRRSNPLIERNPRLAKLSDAELAWNLEGNISLTAFKLKSMFDSIGAMSDEEIIAIKERTGTDLSEIRRKANCGNELDLAEVSALYAAYNEEPERGMESGSYWDWLKARDIRTPIAERVAYQYAELCARGSNNAHAS